MKTNTINVKTKKLLTEVLFSYPLVLSIVQKITEHAGKALLVGGAVRDLLLGITPKDLDIEVHSLSIGTLEKIIGQFGSISFVGKSFGVLRLHELNIDWSLPRKDSMGRRPHVTIDAHMDFKTAFARRDLTINAMGIDLTTYELIDPFDGLLDLQDKILRAPDSARFIEDPLRFYRVMQFIGRFEMNPNDELNELCSRMDISSVSIERIEAEFEKLLLKSARPSRGIRWLKDCNRLQEILPELAATIGIEQSIEWHPEGDVFEHSMQALDAAADIVNNSSSITMYDDPKKKLILLYGALCHDLGKVHTTRKIDGVWRSLGHETAGAQPTKELLSCITVKTALIAQVVLLVKCHMIPMQLVASEAKPAAYKRLAHTLAPDLTIKMLADLCLADKRGRNAHGPLPLHDNYEDIAMFTLKSLAASVHETAQLPILLGRDLLDVVSPGPILGQLVKRAYEIQLDEDIVDAQELKRRVLDDYIKREL